MQCICCRWTLYPKINFQPIRTCLTHTQICGMTIGHVSFCWTCITLHSMIVLNRACSIFIPPAFMLSGVYSFLLSVSSICMRTCVSLLEFTSKFYNSFSNGYISVTTHQKAFILGSWLPWRVCLLSINFGPRVHVPGWGWGSKGHLKKVLNCFFFYTKPFSRH